MTENKVEIDVEARTQGANQALGEVHDKLRDLNGPLRELLEATGQLRKTFIEAFAVREISELIEHVAELGETAIRSSEMLGMSVEKVQELGFAARMVGGSSEGMTMALMRLEKNMADIKDPASMAAKAFGALGISAETLKDKSPEQVLGIIADKFMNAKDGADKTAIAMDLMSRTGAMMIPELNKGSEGLKQLGAAATETGSVLTETQAKGLEKTAQGLTTLKASLEGTSIALVELFKPAIDTVISGLTFLIQRLTDVFNGLRLIVEIIEATLIIAFAKLSEEFAIFGITAEKYIEEIKVEFTALGQVIDDVAHLHFDKAVQDWELGSKRIVAAEKDAAASIADVSQQYMDFKNKVLDATTALFTFSSAEDEVGKKTKLTAPSSGTQKDQGEKTELAIEKNDLATELELNKLLIQARKDRDQALVDSGKMSQFQQLEDLKKFTAEETAASLRALDQEASYYDEDSAEYNALMNKKKIITAQYNNEISKINNQELAAQKKQWDAYFSSIKSGMSQMVNGILQGTQTWQQAMLRIWSNLLLKFIDDFVVQAVLNWVKAQALQLAASQSFQDALAALGLQSLVTQHAQDTAQGTAKMTSNAAQVYAGVFAALAPAMGPAAAGPAAAAEAQVLSMIPQASMAVGAWELDTDMVAQLHKGEMVVPQTFAQGLRSGDGSLGSGGDSYNIGFTIQALDAQSVSQLLKSQGPLFAQMIAQQIRQFNPKMKQ